MKLVISYTMGDGCSWSSDVVECVEYSSIEEFYLDFEREILKEIAIRKKGYNPHNAYSFIIAGIEFIYEYFWYRDCRAKVLLVSMPEIQELEEWFNSKNQDRT